MTLKVTIEEVHTIDVDVEVDDTLSRDAMAEQAREKAESMISNEEIDLDELAYSHHTPNEDWTVEGPSWVQYKLNK